MPTKFKKLVHDRMRETGESWQAAQRHVRARAVGTSDDPTAGPASDLPGPTAAAAYALETAASPARSTGAATSTPGARTVCACAAYGAAPILARLGEEVTFKQCDACRDRAIEVTRYNMGMVLGWIDVWKDAYGIDPAADGPPPNPNSPAYWSPYGLDDRAFNADLAAWQKRASMAANTLKRSREQSRVGAALARMDDGKG